MTLPLPTSDEPSTTLQPGALEPSFRPVPALLTPGSPGYGGARSTCNGIVHDAARLHPSVLSEKKETA